MSSVIGEMKGEIKGELKGERKGILEKMAKDKLVIGLDLSDEFSQVSYYGKNQEKPESVSMVVGSDQICVPTVLTKKNGENIWCFGREAVNLYENQQGILVDHLVEKARKGDLIQVDHKEYDPVDLLTLFIKKCLAMIAVHAPLEKVSVIMITVNEPDSRMIEILDKAVETLRIKPDKVFYQSHTESAYHYMLHQAKDIWNHDVLILHLTSEGLLCRSMRKNIRTTPIVVLMEERKYANFCFEDFSGASEGRIKRKDQELHDILYAIMEGKLYSAVYLLGDGFEGEWCKESLKYMCRNRRVFRGNNMFRLGACYGAREKLETSELASKYIFLGKDKVKANIGMRVYREGEEVYMALLDAGMNWYDTSREIDLILDREDTIKLIITPLNGINTRNAHIYLTGIPVRPPRATRVHLELKMLSEKRLFVRVTDLGFGEFYPATNMQWTGELEVY